MMVVCVPAVNVSSVVILVAMIVVLKVGAVICYCCDWCQRSCCDCL